MKKIYLIDGNNFIYRMFYGLPEFTTKDWKIVNAIFWMAKFFVHQLRREKPDYLFFIKDWKGKNFRHELYSEYKATRDRMPDNLKVQIDDIEKMIKMMWIEVIELNWFEADDIIWSLATELWKDEKNNIFILSWDKDLYSLVNERVKIYDTMKKKIFDREKTIEKFQIWPEFIVDYLSIVWDSSDNIPWIAWFWPQKAIELIKNIWWIEKIYEEVEKVKNWEKSPDEFEKSVSNCFKWRTFEKLIESKDKAFLSKKLASLDLDIKLPNFNLENFKFHGELLINNEIKQYFRDLEFISLLSEVEEQKIKTWNDLWLKVQLIQNKNDLEKLWNLIKSYKQIVLDTETTSLNIIDANLVWISIYLDDNNIFYINRWHNWEKIEDEDLKYFLNNLFKLDILIIGHNIKYDLQIIDLFLKNNTKLEEKTFWQMSFQI